MRIRTFLLAAVTATALPVQAELTLDDAIQQAISNDHWAQSSIHQEQALRQRAIASGQLPDPKMRVALANLPTDTFDFDQENMTQLQLGLSQQFPRGNSLQIRQQQLSEQADKAPLQRTLRAAQVKRQLSMSWLKLNSLQQQLRLLENNRHLFQELVEISRANYRSGRVQRFEVIDAELQITRLNDRITRMRQQAEALRGDLQRWLPAVLSSEPLPAELPTVQPLVQLDDQALLKMTLQRHPQLQMLERDIDMLLTSDPMQDHPELTMQPVLRDPFVLLVAEHHTELSGSTVLELVQSLPFIAYNRQLRLGSLTQLIARRIGVELPTRFELDNTTTLLRFVQQGHGWAFAPVTCLLQNPALLQGVKILPIDQGNHARYICLLSRRGEFGDLPQQVVQICQEIYTQQLVPQLPASAPWLQDQAYAIDELPPL